MSRLMLLIQLGNDTRALSVSEIPSYAVLKQLAISTFPRLYSSNFVFMKKDDGGNMVSISDDTQLRYVRPKSTLLHLFIIPMAFLPSKTDSGVVPAEQYKGIVTPNRAFPEKNETARTEVEQNTPQEDVSKTGGHGGESEKPNLGDTPSIANNSNKFVLDKKSDLKNPIEDNMMLLTYDTLNAHLEAFDLDAKLEFAVNKIQSMLKTASKTLEDNILDPLGRIINSKVQEIKGQIMFLKEELAIIRDRYATQNKNYTVNSEAYLIQNHMKTLEAMGFKDRGKNMKAIHAHINSIEGIVERILNNE